jgi:hypothetical protein
MLPVFAPFGPINEEEKEGKEEKEKTSPQLSHPRPLKGSEASARILVVSGEWSVVSGVPSQPPFRYPALPCSSNTLLVIPTAERDLIGSAVRMPLACNEYHLVILEGSVLGAGRLSGKRSTPMLFPDILLLPLPQILPG